MKPQTRQHLKDICELIKLLKKLKLDISDLSKKLFNCVCICLCKENKLTGCNC